MGQVLRDPRPSNAAPLALVLAGVVLGAPPAALAGPSAPEPAPAADPGPPPDPSEDTAEAQDEADEADEADETAVPDSAKPPRLDGPYVGGILLSGVGLTRLQSYDTDPFTAFGGAFRFGEMVLPWLGLGLALGGSYGIARGTPSSTLGQGGMMVDTTFVPLAKRRIPLSLRASFGFGGGAVRQEGTDGREGFGGAAFAGSVAYTFFPWAKKKRAFRGGGFGLGPELGWMGFPPTSSGGPMSNTISLGLTTTFYFGS